MDNETNILIKKLKKKRFYYCFCKKKPEPRIRDIDRDFSDMIEMEVIDRNGNLIFGKKNKAVQTDHFIETKGFDI